MRSWVLPVVLAGTSACLGRGMVAVQQARPPADEQTAVLPLTVAPWPVVEATVNGAPVRLMVDTGAATSVLDRSIADSVGLRRSGHVRVRDFENRSRKLSVMIADQLDLGGMVFSEVGLVLSEISVVTAQSCIPIDGIVGQNVLRHAAMELDVRGKTMVLSGSVDALPVREGGQVVRLDPGSVVPRIQLPGEGLNPYFMIVDTGAAKALAVSDRDMRRLFAKGRPPGPVVTGRGKLTGGLHGMSDEISEVQYFLWPSIELGGLDLSGVAAMSGTGSTVLGLEILSRYLVRFDSSAHAMTLWDSGEPLPRGLSDIGVRWRHESGEVSILVDGSPAQEAGIRLGDRVIEVDGTVLDELDETQRCWVALQAPDSASLWLRIERGGTNFDVELRERALLPGPEVAESQ